MIKTWIGFWTVQSYTELTQFTTIHHLGRGGWWADSNINIWATHLVECLKDCVNLLSKDCSRNWGSRIHNKSTWHLMFSQGSTHYLDDRIVANKCYAHNSPQPHTEVWAASLFFRRPEPPQNQSKLVQVQMLPQPPAHVSYPTSKQKILDWSINASWTRNRQLLL